MYLPYLRGKQFELIALRDTVSVMASENKVSPIIEPVKKSDSTLSKTINALKQSNVNFTLIINPRVGDFERKHSALIGLLKPMVNGYSNFQYGLIIDEAQDASACLKLAQEHLPQNSKLTIIHKSPSEVNLITAIEAAFDVKYQLIHHKIVDRHFKRKLKKGVCSRLDNPFNSQTKNADYSRITDEAFTMEHQYFSTDGYGGFADFVTIGEDFQESGFLPYAVAFHLTYMKGDEVRVHHFVSDSNNDNTDVPGKFAEALEKFHTFSATQNFNTAASQELAGYYASGHYPGLGTLKKISVAHHIELIAQFLSKN